MKFHKIDIIIIIINIIIILVIIIHNFIMFDNLY